MAESSTRAPCSANGTQSRKPETPYSGILSLRIAPELRRRFVEKAAKAGDSVNQFIAQRLEEVS